MKYSIFASLLIFSSCTFPQNKKDYDLEKYSYLFVGIKSVNGGSMIYPIGTCFFARRGKDLFLITAKHNVNGFNTFTLKPTPSQYDTMGFRYYNYKTKQVSYSSLNVMPIKKYLPNNFFYESPDLVVLQMKDTLVEPYINSLEEYVYDSKEDDDILDSIEAYGFGFDDPRSFSSTTKPILYSGQVNDALPKDPFYPSNDSIYYISQPISIQGMSGAPVFLKYRSKRTRREHLLFGGVLFGKDDPYNSAYIVIPGLVKSQIVGFITSPR